MDSHSQYETDSKGIYKHSRGLGKDLENDLNRSNATYRIMDKAIIHKKPTPISVVKVSYPSRSAAKITEAYYNIPSTTDYCGIYNGFYIDFEAKETSHLTRFNLSLIHQHQYDHLVSIKKHGGIAFLVVRLTSLEQDYLIWIEDLEKYMSKSSKQSISFSWIQQHAHPIPYRYKIPCDYLSLVESKMQKENL